VKRQKGGKTKRRPTSQNKRDKKCKSTNKDSKRKKTIP
jgi:hypothetical protein